MTSLLPVVLFPLLGIASTNETAVVYMNVCDLVVLQCGLKISLKSFTGNTDDVLGKLDDRLGCRGVRSS